MLTPIFTRTNPYNARHYFEQATSYFAAAYNMAARTVSNITNFPLYLTALCDVMTNTTAGVPLAIVQAIPSYQRAPLPIAPPPASEQVLVITWQDYVRERLGCPRSAEHYSQL